MRPDPRRLVARVRPARSARDGGGSADRDLVRASGLFDRAWVETQLGRSFASEDDAVDAYLATPDCSPHPLFVAEWIDHRFGRPPKAQVDPLLWYLRDERARRWSSPHPLVDPRAIYAVHPGFRDAPHGPLAAWLRHHAPDEPLPAGESATTLSPAAATSTSLAAVRAWLDDASYRFAPRTSPTPPEEPAVPVGPLPARADGTPLVTVVMPLWNRAREVRPAIESVQAQTHQDWELVVVDDGSSDDSLAVVTGIAHFDPRIVVVAGEHRGVSATRNTALARARGRYVAFLDTDNTWRPDFLRVLLGALEQHGWQMAHGALRARRDGEEYHRAFEGTHRHLLVANHVDLNVLVARTDLVREAGGFDESLRRGVDYDLVLRLAERTDLHLVPYVGVDYVDDEVGTTRISTAESPAWLSVIASRHLVDWDAEASRARTPGLTSVILPARASIRADLRWMRELAALPDVELVIVGSRLPRWQHVVLTVLAEAFGDTSLAVLQADRGVPTALNVGYAASSGDRVVLVLGQAEADAAAVSGLARCLDDPGVAVVQPLVLDPTGVVLSAGAVFGPDTVRPEPFLHGHPVDDAQRMGRSDVPAALGSVVGVRADVLAALRGLDPLYGDMLAETDLSLRVHEHGLGRVVLDPDVELVADDPVLPDPAQHEAALRVFDARFATPPPGSTRAWEAAGFDIVAHRNLPVSTGAPGPEEQPLFAQHTVVRPLRVQVVEGTPHLRWAIDLASPSGKTGEAWGDTHYGRALAAALRRQGQTVAVDSRHARHRPSRDHDDVVLVLRGLDAVAPRPGRVNLEWVISHPDLVTPEEVASFDRVYAASIGWSATVSRDWGVHVEPLLQATDPAQFHPGRAAFDTGPDVLFVGNSRGVFRSSLRHAMAAGADVTVHGAGWREILPAGTVRTNLVANDELGALYASAGLVLNDHWEDMRLTGFVSNRLMDAAACGARVASDEIPGLDLSAMFGGLVQTYADEDGMRRILAGRAELFPDAEGRRAAAARVVAEHSFDARAAVLLDDAVRLRSERAAHAVR